MVDVTEQDQWISHLSDCKQLAENDIKRLCDKVRLPKKETYCLLVYLANKHLAL